MPRPTTYERARLYVSRMPEARSGNGGDAATFAVALVLVQGFDLARHESRQILDEYNARCVPPWTDNDLEHKLNQAERQGGFGTQPRGCLRDEGGAASSKPSTSAPAQKPATPAPAKPQFDLGKLQRAAGSLAGTVDLLWLANRSHSDPALVTPGKFLSALYRKGEKVLVFQNDKTQGEALWPAEELPTTGPRGVWFLCQPVDGEYRPNPRKTPKEGEGVPMSRRIEECVTDWRFLVIESDKAPLKEWLAVLAQLPLRIAAIYTSGGRSIHALVRIDAATKAAWDDAKHKMLHGLVILGADPGAMSAVRLTRLPGCYREGKDVKQDGGNRYERFPKPALQKLLYLNPAAPLRPLLDMPSVRNIERDWLRIADAGIAESDLTGGAGMMRALAYYAPRSEKLREALARLTSEAAPA